MHEGMGRDRCGRKRWLLKCCRQSARNPGRAVVLERLADYGLARSGECVNRVAGNGVVE
jgi:hypothetical protein